MFKVPRKRINLRLMPVETVLLVYLFITGVLILVFSTKLENKGIHLSFRLFVLIVIVIFLAIDSISKSKRYIKFIRLLFPFLVLVYIYRETNYLNNLFFKDNLDSIFSHFERSIFHCQPSILFATVLPSNMFAEMMYFGYFMYYLMVISIPIYIYFFVSRYLAERSVFVIIASFVFYYLIFIVLPVIGPQFYYAGQMQKLPNGYIFGPVLRYLQHYGEAPTAAFPSSHVSICLMVLWICYKNEKKLLYLILPVSVLLLFSTVYIRAHYVIDVVAGIIFTPFVYALSMNLFTALSKRYTNQNSYTLTNEYSNQRSKKSA